MTWPTPSMPGSVYIPSQKRTEPFGPDVSRHQGPIDFQKLKAYQWPVIDFIAARAGISWGYKDGWFKTFWNEFYKTLNVPRAAYHVLYPAQNPADQVANFAGQFPNGFDGDVVVSDVELQHGVSRAKLSEAVYDFNNRLQDWTKKPLLCYTRFTFITGYMDYQTSKYIDMLEGTLWWMAQYMGTPVEDERNVIVPDKLKGLKMTVAMHQTGSKGDGTTFGMASKEMDTNRWLLGPEFFKDVWGRYPLNHQTVDPLDELNQRLTNLEEHQERLADEIQKIWEKLGN